MGVVRIFLNYLIIIFGLFTTASCQSKVKSTAIVMPKQDKLFKQWIRDTTAVMNKHLNVISNGLIKSQIVIAPDSLLFSDFKTYEFDSKNMIKNDEISNVVSLLREYDELPSKNYKLSFMVEKNYSPSMSEGSKYDFDSELKNILVKTSQSNTEYSYIKGRISGKKVFKANVKNKNYNLYDFVWEGDKLIKRRLN